MGKKEDKTNVMRILEMSGIDYKSHKYDVSDDAIDGVSVAHKVSQPVERVFKTLVTRGAGGDYFVFCIPVAQELDLKKAARAAGEKSVAMIAVADINKVTGYIRGGCSPVGMKHQFKTVFDKSIDNIETVLLSAGKIGYQVEIKPSDIISVVGGTVADLIRNENTDG